MDYASTVCGPAMCGRPAGTGRDATTAAKKVTPRQTAADRLVHGCYAPCALHHRVLSGDGLRRAPSPGRRRAAEHQADATMPTRRTPPRPALCPPGGPRPSHVAAPLPRRRRGGLLHLRRHHHHRLRHAGLLHLRRHPRNTWGNPTTMARLSLARQPRRWWGRRRRPGARA